MLIRSYVAQLHETSPINQSWGVLPSNLVLLSVVITGCISLVGQQRNAERDCTSFCATIAPHKCTLYHITTVSHEKYFVIPYGGMSGIVQGQVCCLGHSLRCEDGERTYRGRKLVLSVTSHVIRCVVLVAAAHKETTATLSSSHTHASCRHSYNYSTSNNTTAGTSVTVVSMVSKLEGFCIMRVAGSHWSNHGWIATTDSRHKQ